MPEHSPDHLLQSALAHHQAGRVADAETLYRRILTQFPDHPKTFNLLGVLLAQTGRPDAAVEALQHAVALDPAPAYWCNLGLALKGLGQIENALAAYRTAIRLQPNFPEAHNNLGNLLKDLGQIDDAIAACREATRLKTDYAEAFNNLGNALQLKGDLDAAANAFRDALALRPYLPEAHNNLGTTLKSRGELDAAIAACREALRLRPTYAEAHSNLLYAMHFHPAFDAPALKHEHLEWNRRHAAPLRSTWPHHANDLTPDRRLRIGYVSPDFRGHAVGLFMAPLLATHDHTAVEIFCYSDVLAEDALTGRLRSHADHWRPLVGLSDTQAATLITQDKIDILVDLTMHMSRNRLRLFARKPAPLQVTYLAYCSTTGLEAIDYRITDPHLDPPGTDTNYAEKSLRLPDTYWCYHPAIDMPGINPLPSSGEVGGRGAGEITFGCLNNFSKVSIPTLETWALLLVALPNSRLLLHAPEGAHRHRILRFLERFSIAPARIDFVPLAPTADYLRHYHGIDIALDPFPYGGGTTTLDALFMGVPVITLKGNTAVGRGGTSILTNLALSELIANTPNAYIHIAADLANNPARLTLLRQTLRARLQASPLMNPARFTQNLESLYQKIWRYYCTTRL